MTETHRHAPQTQYVRRSDLVGLELVLAQPARGWDRYSGGFELMLSTGSAATVWHRGREIEFSACRVLLAGPGDVLAFKRIRRPGSVLIVSVDAELGGSVAHKAPLAALLDAFKVGVVDDPSVGNAMHALSEALLQPHDAEQVRRQLGVLLSELAMPAPESPRGSALDARPDALSARMRDWVHADTCELLDLQTLADWTGLSRFQVIRAFKRRFGLPPHAYRLRSRLSMAKGALCLGLQPARVAAECGFTDQSHLTRHFKRVFGVTPAQYARLALRPPPAHPLPKGATGVAA